MFYHHLVKDARTTVKDESLVRGWWKVLLDHLLCHETYSLRPICTLRRSLVNSEEEIEIIWIVLL